MKKQLHLKWAVSTTQIFIANLDPDFTPVNSDEKFHLAIKQSTFLGGEPYLRFTDHLADATQDPNAQLFITQRADNVEDFFRVVIASDAARRLGFKNISLVLPYFPGARQDRVCNEGESLTVKVYADMINRCNFDAVYILTPHSDVTPALINNVELLDDLVYAEKAVADIYQKTGVNSFMIICPDAGAGKRIEKIVKHLKATFATFHNFDVVNCEKVRDLATGELQSFKVHADDRNLSEYNCIIFDDIVSMGGTFIGLNSKLKEVGAKRVYLSVSHADCLKGVVKMCGEFDGVYITNSRKISHAGLKNLTIWPIGL